MDNAITDNVWCLVIYKLWQVGKDAWELYDGDGNLYVPDIADRDLLSPLQELIDMICEGSTSFWLEVIPISMQGVPDQYFGSRDDPFMAYLQKRIEQDRLLAGCSEVSQ
jgi:hypothetical protein